MADVKNAVQRASSPGPVDDPDYRARLGAALGGSYVVDAMIGQGGFGRVYSGRDVRLDRAVAIKVIRPELAGASAFLDRFRREAMAMAKFRHPGIVPVFDIREGD